MSPTVTREELFVLETVALSATAGGDEMFSSKSVELVATVRETKATVNHRNLVIMEELPLEANLKG